jgi:hypothetical protein
MSASVRSGRSVFVPLDDTEHHIAAEVGVMRRLQIIRRGLGFGHGNYELGAWDRHLVGAIAELAFAKYLGVYWGGGGIEWWAGDVRSIEVRATTYATGHLIAYESDPDDRVIVLGIVETNGVSFVGGTTGAHAKRVEFSPPPGKQRPNTVAVYWVPQDALRIPIGRIRALALAKGIT